MAAGAVRAASRRSYLVYANRVAAYCNDTYRPPGLTTAPLQAGLSKIRLKWFGTHTKATPLKAAFTEPAMK
jgi:hypothetical protein